MATLLEHWERDAKYTMAQAKRRLKVEMMNIKGFNPTRISLKKGILLAGHSGIGKTSIVEQAAAEVMAELWTTQVGGNVTEDNHGLQKVDGNQSVHAVAAHMAPLFRAPSSATGIGAALFDEVATGDKMHQNDVRVMIDGRLDEHDIHPGWRKFACTNPPLAEYGTVNDLDQALLERFKVICLDPTAEEKLEFWAKNMQPTVYKFLLFNFHQAKGSNVVNKLSPRVWDIVADGVERLRLAGEGEDIILKEVQSELDTTTAELFDTFLKAGNNPDAWPLRAEELILAEEKDLKVMMGRVGRWLTKEETKPLVFATKWDILQWIKDKNNETRLQDKKTGSRITHNITEFMVDIGAGGHTDMAYSMLEAMRGTSLINDAVRKVKGTALEKKFVEAYGKSHKAQQAVSAA